jgi:hypothetical protein
MATMDKQFRISAKRIFITYAGIKEKLASGQRQREMILEQMKKKIPIGKYLIVEERHKDGSYHYHCIFEGEKKYDIKKQEMLDITIEGKEHHGNYQKVRNLRAAIKYCLKEDKEYITNYKFTKTGEIMTEYHEIIDIAENDLENAIEKYKEKNPKDYIKNLRTIETNLGIINARKERQLEEIPLLIEKNRNKKKYTNIRRLGEEEYKNIYIYNIFYLI